METEQKLNIISSDHPVEDRDTMHFDIQYDQGNVYIPGQISCHSCYKVIYSRNNCGAEFFADGEHYSLQRGDLVIVKPYIPHGFVTYSKSSDPYAGYVVTVSEEYANTMVQQEGTEELTFLSNSKVIHTRGTLWERIEDLFTMTLEESGMKAPGWKAAFFGSSLVLLVQIARAAAVDPSEAGKTDKAELLAGILAYVENNLSEKITLEDVASRFFVSASTVTHLFSKKMDISFYKYVMQRRLLQAKNLIKEGMPMEKVAVQVGFGDYSAFYRAFKQEFGMSPRQYYKGSSEK